MASSRCEAPNTMHVLAAGNSDYRSESPNNRPISRHSVGSRAGVVDSGSPRRTPTPSKQVSLTSVRRKEDLVSATDEKTASSSTEAPKRVNGFYRDVQAVSSRLNQKDANTTTDPLTKASDTHNCESHDSLNGEISEDRLSADESDSSSEDEVTTAPSELLMEFLDCVMDEDYENAQKLCKMILLYEPDNPEALKFQPLIEAKLLQEEEGSGDDGSGDESGDDDDDDDESDDDTDDDDSSEESSDQSESDADDDVDDSSTVQLQQP